MSKNKFYSAKVKKSIAIAKYIKKLDQKKISIKINNFSIENYVSGNMFLLAYFNEMFEYFEQKKIQKISICVKVIGGGIFSQIAASRLACCNAILSFFKKDEYLRIKKERKDLLFPDVRRKYMKLALRKGAKARYQLSFR